MKKADSLKHWRELPNDQDPLARMTPIPYKTSGSRYGCCGIRIDGNPEFIDAVLSRLKPLLDGENHVTRLELARNQVACREGYNAGQNAATGSECCYIRLHMRGAEGAMASAVFDTHLHAATNRFAKSINA
jgi:hypothetical protein